MIDCITKWYCKRLNKEITVDVSAIPELDPLGFPMWICDCKVKRHQQWTSGKDPFHIPLARGFRNSPNSR